MEKNLILKTKLISKHPNGEIWKCENHIVKIIKKPGRLLYTCDCFHFAKFCNQPTLCKHRKAVIIKRELLKNNSKNSDEIIEYVPETTKQNGLNKLTPRQKQAIKELVENKCQFCGKSSEEVSLEIHRIKPGYKGGKYTIGNIQVLCQKCHDQRDESW